MMTLTALLNEYEIEHFTERELRKASSINIPERLFENIIPTLLVHDKMRKELGFKITLTNVFRSWADHVRIYNELNAQRKAEGEPPLLIPKTSLHLDFNAIDSRPTDRDPKKLEMMKSWLKSFVFPIRYDGDNISNAQMGLGLNYATFIHSDTRGILGKYSPARW